MDRSLSFREKFVRAIRGLRGVPALLLLTLLPIASLCQPAERQSPEEALLRAASKAQGSTVYVNEEYGFQFELPHDWTGFSAIREGWNGTVLQKWSATSPQHPVQHQSGPLIRIRHPEYTEDEPYEDIPIMVFTHKQWKNVKKEKLIVSAAPFPPFEIGHNSKYVFATPPRFYYDFATGYEEVLHILENQPRTFPPVKHSNCQVVAHE